LQILFALKFQSQLSNLIHQITLVSWVGKRFPKVSKFSTL